MVAVVFEPGEKTCTTEDGLPCIHVCTNRDTLGLYCDFFWRGLEGLFGPQRLPECLKREEQDKEEEGESKSRVRVRVRG